MSDLDDVQKELTKMARDLIKKATPETAMDTFKAVSTWHVAMKKVSKGENDHEDSTFSAVRAQVRDAA